LTVRIRLAATVILVRDSEPGLEVFMVRRNPKAVFGAGAHVFPGGAVDAADRQADLAPLCEGRSEKEASALLGIEHGGLAFWVAGIRECFEEAGLLLAYGPDGEIVRLGDAREVQRFAAHRAAVDSGRRRLVEVCLEEGLRLAVDGLFYFSHWITPEGAPRRFDTRFVVGAAPGQQTPLHDARETIAHEWVRPADALERHRAGRFELMTPTIRSLETVAGFACSADLLAAAAAGPMRDAQPCPG
jgi:8-oxo-dGTP pyrophosphatase MutT (NUDIX family)